MNKNYTKKKLKSQMLKNSIKLYISEEGMRRIETCNNWVQFKADDELEHAKVLKANNCKNRFCPICAWKKAKKDALMIDTCCRYISSEHRKVFMFIGLTVPNVTSDKLSETIDRMNTAYFKLVQKNAQVKKVLKGSVRKLEVTYNGERTITQAMYDRMQGYFDRRFLGVGDENPNYDTYHPHFHVLAAVNPSYFKSRDYISERAWLEFWRECTGIPEITQVNTIKVSGNSGKDAREIAKYSAKDSDYLGRGQDVFDAFYSALKGRQLITYSGLFKEAVKLYKDGLLEKYKDIDETVYSTFLFYDWCGKEYSLREKRPLKPTDICGAEEDGLEVEDE